MERMTTTGNPYTIRAMSMPPEPRSAGDTSFSAESRRPRRRVLRRFTGPKGSTLKQLHQDPDRLSAPMVKHGNDAAWLAAGVQVVLADWVENRPWPSSARRRPGKRCPTPSTPQRCELVTQRDVPVRLLYGFVAIGVAVLGVCLTSVSILVGGLGDQYLQILDKAGGIRAALQPIKTVATVGAVTVATSVCGALLWAVGYELRPGAFAVPAGFAVWTFVGAVQVVNLIAFHGEQRGQFIVQTNEARRSLKSVKDVANG